MKNIWSLDWENEYGETGSYIFDYAPTAEQQKKFIEAEHSDEIAGGVPFYWELHQVKMYQEGDI